MKRTTVARRVIAALGFTMVATLATPGTAAAGPVEDGLAKLQKQVGDSPAAQIALSALEKKARLTDVNGTYAPFLYAAPTIGCGDTLWTTLTGASGAGGPDATGTLNYGQLRFQASPRYPGVAIGQGLTVMWLNTANGAAGVDAMDGLNEFGTPSLSKVVNSGPGNVFAVLWGHVNYPDAICVVTPTVGMFTVAAPPPPPADPAAPGADKPATGSGGF